MKKSYRISVLVALTCLVIVFSCDKIDQVPISSISTESYWKTANDATGAAVGMHSRFTNVTAADLFNLGEMRSATFVQGLAATDFSGLRINDMDAETGSPDWTNLYTTVHDANLVLKYVPDITNFASENDKNRILAQAHTMRAFCYFVMLKSWGTVPLVTEPTEVYDPSIVFKIRSPKEDVIALIKKDIDDAILLFPEMTFPAGRNMWSKPAAYALKADVYLWTAKRENGGSADISTALDALNAMGTADVALLTDYGRIHDYDNKGNKEILMASTFRLNESTQEFKSNRWYIMAGLPKDIPPDVVTKIGTLGGQNRDMIRQEIINQFSSDDTRRDATFIVLYSKDKLGNNTVFVSSVCMKFVGLVSGGARRFYDDVVIYRYADVLLMKAEAKNALGQDPSAEINMIRQRAFGTNFPAHTFINGSQAENDSTILKERLFEFMYEGKYWWDIVRFGKAFTNWVPENHMVSGEDYKLLLPLSKNILSLEPLVTQTPGY